MAIRTQLKKFKIDKLLIFYSLFLFTSLSLADFSPANSKQALPVFHNVGVLPLQVDASRLSTLGLESVIKEFETTFSKMVRGANRFDVLEDELIAELWKTANDRHILVKDYDLSAFIHLTVVPTEESYILIARILNPNLDVLLQESDTVSNNTIRTDDLSSVAPRVKSLVFRLFNRLPIDVSVSSVQGKYITLSGGTAQGITVGDELRLVRPYVHATHPATHAWSDFETVFVGQAKVIEAKETTAIGEITKLLRSNDILTGDGVRVENIACRAFFRDEPVADSSINDEPTKLTQIPIAPPLPPPPPPPPKASPKAAPAVAAKQDNFLAKPFQFLGKYVRKVSEWFSLYVGQEGWYYTGPSSAQSKIRPYLPLNLLGFDMRSHFYNKMQYGYGAAIAYDRTRNGIFTGYDAYVRFFWEDRFPVFQDLFRFNWTAGLEPRVLGLRVDQEQFGGYDLFELRPFVGINSDFEPIAPYRWYLEYTYIPYDAGSIGHQGQKYSVVASYGWLGEAGFFYAPDPKGVQLGTSFSYGDTVLTDSNLSHNNFSHYTIKLIACEQF